MDVSGDPAYIKYACEASLKRLGVDCIDVYYQHRIDNRVPIKITVNSLHFTHRLLVVMLKFIIYSCRSPKIFIFVVGWEH